MSDKTNESPTAFSFSSVITRSDLLRLAKMNSDIDKQCFWLVSQAFSEGIELKDDSPYEGFKFGVPHTFESFSEYLYWSGMWEEIEKTVSFSTLFGIAISVNLNDNNVGELKGNKYFGPTTLPATKTKGIYSITDDSGYWIHKYDENGEPEIYKIQITRKMSDKNGFVIESTEDNRDGVVVYYVHASRVVRFPYLQKDLSYAGTPKSFLTYWIARAKQIYFEAVVNAAKNMSAGTLVRRVANENEMNTLEAANTTPSYQNRVYVVGTAEKLDEIMQIYVPNLNSSQFTEFMTSINKQMAQSSNLSLRIYGEEDIASGLGEGGAAFSTNLIRGEIKDLQQHYKQYIEHIFHLFGRKNTSFEWKEPEQYLPKDDQENNNNKVVDNKDVIRQMHKENKNKKK